MQDTLLVNLTIDTHSISEVLFVGNMRRGQLLFKCPQSLQVISVPDPQQKLLASALELKLPASHKHANHGKPNHENRPPICHCCRRLVAIYIVATPTMAIPGGEWSPVPDVDTPDIQELGRWAVMEHVKKANDGIRFNRVVSAANKVNNFDLIIEAWNSNDKDAKYEAEVYVMDLGAKRALLSFQPAN